MATKYDINETLIKALNESEGKTIDIVIDQTVTGISQEMYEWWGQNMRNTRRYKMWHPDHVSFEVEKNNDPSSPSVGNPMEKLGKYGPSIMRFKGESPSKYPFKPKYKNFRITTHISPDGKHVLGLLCGEYEERDNALLLHQVFRWPAKTPQPLIDALRKHILEEGQNFSKFLPELYKKEGGKK